MKLAVVVGVGFALLSGSLIAGRQPEPQLADGPGKAVVEAVCGECHEAASRITKLKKSEGEWAEVITDMEGRGMTADQKDLDVVLAYLTKYYGGSVRALAVSHQWPGSSKPEAAVP